MKLHRVFDILTFQAEHHPCAAALNCKQDDGWLSWTTEEVCTEVWSLAQGLLDAGVVKGDHLVLVPRAAEPAVIFLDFAIQLVGAVPIVTHSTFSTDQFNHVVMEAQPKFLFFATKDLAETLCQLTPLKADSFIISQEEGSPYHKRFHSPNPDLVSINNRSSQIDESDLSVIIYTSGSTGVPKGVMLSHYNIMSNLGALIPLLPIKPDSRVLSYLPFSHVLERSAVYAYLILGMQIFVIDDIHSLGVAMREVKPVFITAVPRVIERILEGLEKFRVRRGWVRKKMLGWAIDIGSRHIPQQQLAIHHRLYLSFARHFLFRKLRMALGGKLEAIVVGGAHLRPGLARLLEVAGITVREGYGMTETAPIITINRFAPGLHKVGTVGLPISNVEVKIDIISGNEGEILVKGPNVTAGYYERPNLTANLFDSDGWLRTGDIGQLDQQGFLTITDRKKDILKTSAGQYIAPAVLENRFKSSPFVEQLIIIGFQKPFVTAVIVPNFSILEDWCHKNQVHWTSPQYMVHNIKVRALIADEIDVENSKLPKFKRIHDFVLAHEPWTPENGMLSASYKPLRRVIEEKNKKEIDNMYQSSLV